MSKISIKLYIPAGKASAIPPIGPILGQYRLNLIEFCKDFNDQTSSFNDSILLPVTISVFQDGEFEYNIKLPTTNFFLKQILEKEIFSRQLNSFYISVITIAQLYELIHIKWLVNIKSLSEYSYILTLIGSAKSSGIYCIY